MTEHTLSLIAKLQKRRDGAYAQMLAYKRKDDKYVMNAKVDVWDQCLAIVRQHQAEQQQDVEGRAAKRIQSALLATFNCEYHMDFCKTAAKAAISAMGAEPATGNGKKRDDASGGSSPANDCSNGYSEAIKLVHELHESMKSEAPNCGEISVINKRAVEMAQKWLQENRYVFDSYPAAAKVISIYLQNAAPEPVSVSLEKCAVALKRSNPGLFTMQYSEKIVKIVLEAAGVRWE